MNYYILQMTESVRQMKNHLVIIPTFNKNYATKKYVNNLKEKKSQNET